MSYTDTMWIYNDNFAEKFAGYQDIRRVYIPEEKSMEEIIRGLKFTPELSEKNKKAAYETWLIQQRKEMLKRYVSEDSIIDNTVIYNGGSYIGNHSTITGNSMIHMQDNSNKISGSNISDSELRMSSFCEIVNSNISNSIIHVNRMNMNNSEIHNADIKGKNINIYNTEITGKLIAKNGININESKIFRKLEVKGKDITINNSSIFGRIIIKGNHIMIHDGATVKDYFIFENDYTAVGDNADISRYYSVYTIYKDKSAITFYTSKDNTIWVDLYYYSTMKDRLGKTCMKVCNYIDKLSHISEFDITADRVVVLKGIRYYNLNKLYKENMEFFKIYNNDNTYKQLVFEHATESEDEIVSLAKIIEKE